MKFATVTKSMVLGAALILASSAFAGTKANVQLNNATTVNGTPLKAGEYKVEWDGSGPNVELSIMKGKSVIAKVPAHVVDLSSPAANSAAVVKNNADGSTSLSGLRFEGKKYAIELGESSDVMQASGK